MTDQELEGIAAQALNLARIDLERKKELGLFIASYHRGEGLHRMSRIEALLIERLGKHWLDSGARKEVGFKMLQIAFSHLISDAIVFVTPANMFRPTDKMNALPIEEQERLASHPDGHEGHHRAVKDGYFILVDCLSAVAQTRERVCSRIQPVVNGKFLDAPETRVFSQENFGGRLKMFGN